MKKKMEKAKDKENLGDFQKNQCQGEIFISFLGIKTENKQENDQLEMRKLDVKRDKSPCRIWASSDLIKGR